jgi:hypothetical protein
LEGDKEEWVGDLMKERSQGGLSAPSQGCGNKAIWTSAYRTVLWPSQLRVFLSQQPTQTESDGFKELLASRLLG